MTKYFRVMDDFGIDERWHLRAPIGSDGLELDARDFTACHRYDGRLSLTVPLRRPGASLNFTLGDFDMPIIDSGVLSVLQDYAPDDIQAIPVSIDGTEEDFWILNVLRCRKCVDENESEFLVWKATDGRPDKIGQYRMFAKLVVDETAAVPLALFRIEGWRIALIVSERVKDALHENSCTGVRFEAVN